MESFWPWAAASENHLSASTASALTPIPSSYRWAMSNCAIGSPASAAKWYQLAAEAGEPIAQFDIAQRYELGIGVKADAVEALKWFSLAAAQGQKDSIKRDDQRKDRKSV